MRAGSLWIEGDDLHYVDATATERMVDKVLVGSNTNRVGSLWVESGQIHWINSAGTNEYRTDEAVFAAASWRAGSIWTEGANLHWIDESGDERRYEFDVCATCLTITACGYTWNDDRCANCPTAQVLDITWTPDADCGADCHGDVARATDGGSYVTIDSSVACYATPYEWTPLVSSGGFDNSGQCNTNCSRACTAHYYTFRMQTHGIDETVCSSQVSGSTGTKYFCTCAFCSIP